jgi:uncharacterized protein with gpF-like domain
MMLCSLRPALQAFLEAVSGAKAYRRKQRILAPIIAEMESAIGKAFKIQGDAFVKRFAKLKPKFPKLQEADPGETAFDWEPLFDESALETIKAFLGPVNLFTSQALLAGGRAQIAELKTDISFDLKNPRAVAYLKGHAAEMVSKVNDTTRQYLKTIITQGVEGGWSYDRMAEAITERYAEFAVGQPQKHIKSRAHLIAVYEGGQAYEEGHMAVAKSLADSGLSMEKSWLTVHDARVDPLCASNEAAGWILLDKAYPSGHMNPQGHPACRCCGLTRRKGSKGK